MNTSLFSERNDMGLSSNTEVLRLKLSTIPLPVLRVVAKEYAIKSKTATDLVKDLMRKGIPEERVNEIIRLEYSQVVEQRRSMISDEDLVEELNKVTSFNWGVVQGQLDNKIQVNYVRRFCRFQEVIKQVESSLYDEIRNYVICTWYNHWSTVLIENYISNHPKVIPTVKNVKGVDIFFCEQPFDLKITYLPRGFGSPEEAIQDPQGLIVWLYENQGAQRFGADNRLFVVLFDKNSPEDSWKIKRDVDLIQKAVVNFFDNESVSANDEIVFTFKKKTYTAISKILIINK